MALGISQDYEYVGDDQWAWSVWLDGDERELDRVALVEYHLHPTFPNPVRQVTDRPSRFRLKATGWGVFELQALVQEEDGSVQHLTHVLELAYPPEANVVAPHDVGPSGPGEQQEYRRSVFLSAGSADSVLASELRHSLTAKGIEVWSDDDLRPGVPWDLEMARALGRADAVVAVSSDIPSRWVERQVDAAAQHGTKVIPVVVGDDASLPHVPGSTEHIRLTATGEVGDVADSILRAIDG